MRKLEFEFSPTINLFCRFISSTERNYLISTSNHMFGRAILDKLLNCMKNHNGGLSPKLPEPTCGYCLITPNSQRL